MDDQHIEKPLEWIGSSYKDLLALPKEVRSMFGFALSLAQMGEKHVATKVLKGFGGAGVLEVIENGGHNGRGVAKCKRESLTVLMS